MPELENPIGERTPLIQHSKPSSTNWFETLLPYSLGVLATIPMLPFVLTSTPEEISQEWWDSLSTTTQVGLVLKTLNAFIIGSTVRAMYFRQAGDNLKKILYHCLDSFTDSLSSAALFIFAGITAIPMGALGYYSGSWAGKAMSILSFSTNYLTTFLFRILFIPNLANMILDRFNPHIQFQQYLLSRLHCLEPGYCAELNLRHTHRTLKTEEDLKQLMVEILSDAEKKIVFTKKPSSYTLRSNAQLLLALCLGLSCSIVFFEFIAQETIEGLNLFCLFFFTQCALSSLSYTSQLALSVLPALAASTLTLITGFTFISTVIPHLYRHLREKPHDILKTIFIVFCCLFSAEFILNAAASITYKENLFNVRQPAQNNQEWMHLVFYLAFSYVGAFIFDCSAMLNQFDLLTTEPIPIVEQAKKGLEKNTLSESSVEALRGHSIFTEGHSIRLSTKKPVPPSRIDTV